uniref:Vesicle-associated membrane protein-associated protein B-like n=1 Tax=Phallusia mammillata TaxID=59560 RepID=A0A6F9DXJ7_9ASCI|nr:vesicle-associated membrane protein-associated protein B-like [Phallusia mammillata]
MSRKQSQVLDIDPMTELRFKGPFTDVVTSQLKLKNPSHQRVCFKVKTTAPKRYCVRPNSGFVDPGATVSVSVMLQPMDADAADKGKHKFMVQSMFAIKVGDDVEKLWAEASPGDLMDSKLRCVFEDPDSEAAIVREEAPEVKSEVKQGFEGPADSSSNQAELQSIMEECKRLQSANAKLKQINEEYKSKLAPDRSGNSETLAQQKRQFTLFIIIAFVMGVLLGYILL